MKFTTADAVSRRARARRWRVLASLVGVGAALGLASLCTVAVAAGAEVAWRFEPAAAPPPPPGVAPAPDPLPLGGVGQISFWAPNRGLLITGGTQSAEGVVPSGLYAYDGVSWHEFASVCGGAKGRIAWAGPDEFWTIADQRAGQITSSEENQGDLEALSLCHFVGDEVVGSYAMPLGEPNSYLEMDAAACLSPGDCWFAGQDGQPPNQGSFHLHWNGSEVSAYYDPSDHAVASMASFDDRFYEGLAIGEDDSYLPSEEPQQPPVIRTIGPAGQTPLCGATGEPSSFCDATLFSVFSVRSLPEYPERVLSDALGGMQLATDGGPLGTGATQLWAGANPAAKTPQGSGPAKLTILHDAKGDWTQLIPARNGGSPLSTGATLSGSSFEVRQNAGGEAGFDSIAPVPGTESAWLSLSSETQTARVALLEVAQCEVEKGKQEPCAKLAQTDLLPEVGEDVGYRGTAGPIACPAADDCWMVTGGGTVSGGWLFHLTDGTPIEANGDPLFDGADGVIAARPPDSGVPTIYPDGFAEDDSLANQQPAPVPVQPPEPAPVKPAKAKKGKPLVTHIKSRFVHSRTLVITFTLTAEAHVRLIARRGREVVATTRDESLRSGRHTLSLSFDPAHWPSKLQFQAKPIGAPAPANGGSGESESGDTITTG
jgi:hypothetical protein